MCEKEEIAQDNLPNTVAKKLQTRLAELRAISSLSEFKDLFGELLKNEKEGDKEDIWSIALTHNYFLIFTSNHLKNPRTESEDLDLERITRIKVLSIKNENSK